MITEAVLLLHLFLLQLVASLNPPSLTASKMPPIIEDITSELLWTLEEKFVSLESIVNHKHEIIQNLAAASNNDVQPKNNISLEF